MRGVLREHAVTLFGISAPLLILLFGWVPWEKDIRNEPIPQRVVRLKTSPWSWDQVEYKRLLETVDPNLRIEGKPLFVAIAIEGKDEQLLRRMLARGAKANSSDWGCTPFLEALAADDSLSGATGRVLPFSTLLLNNRADPNGAPDLPARRKLQHDHPCFSDRNTRDDALDRGDQSILAIAFYAHDWNLVSLLLEHGARTKSRDEASGLMTNLPQLRNEPDGPSGKVQQRLMALLRKEVGPIEFYDDGDTPLSRAVRSTDWSMLGTLFAEKVDSNKRTKAGTLPIQIALEQCTAVPEPIRRPAPLSSFSSEDYERRRLLQAWKEQDAKAQEANKSVAAVIKDLLDAGANPNLPVKGTGSPTETLVSIATERCSSDIPRLLVARGAKVDPLALKASVFDLRDFFYETLRALEPQ